MSEEFAHDASRNALWRAFLKKNELIAPPLAEVVAQLHLALWPALTEAVALAVLSLLAHRPARRRARTRAPIPR